ncbi:hypothetical protein FIBSPDRAFT_1041463 [Athelia psychrophila]|uniref:DUF6533 domain-containing protein n=1 Tax=Athelia psychrophila TaxID=1759441 RepID=A0A166NRK0_9AGAM|nr:hypothetical protein FIBSPDRAFT_1041463 [Fibularhizoctonia sp. CBS 109695]
MASAPPTSVPAGVPPAMIEELTAIAMELQLLRFVELICLTMCVWDWTLSISDELHMVSKASRRPRLSYCLNAAYFLLRLSGLGWHCSNFLLSNMTAGLSDTNGVMQVVLSQESPIAAVASVVFDTLTLPVASWLFYIRLCAVLRHDKRAMAFFGALWATVFAYFIYDGVSARQRFITLHVIVPGKVDAWVYIINAIFDTLVYLAVSWQLATFSVTGGGFKRRLLSFTTGDGLLGLTKALLRGGQIYYFTCIAFGVATIYVLYSDKVSSGSPYKGIIPPLHVCFASILACRIFRELKLGVIPG